MNYVFLIQWSPRKSKPCMELYWWINKCTVYDSWQQSIFFEQTFNEAIRKKTSWETQKRIFNYSLSRFCHSSENAFGKIAAQFQTVNSPINLVPEKVVILVLADKIKRIIHTKRICGWGKSRDWWSYSWWVETKSYAINPLKISVSENCNFCWNCVSHFK